MKTRSHDVVLGALSVIAVFAVGAAPARGATGGVKKVVVYPDRAQVSRVARARCGPHTTVAFEAIPPSADVGSVRAHVSAGAVLGLRTEERTRADAFNAEAQAIDDQLRALDKQSTTLGDAESRTAAAKALAIRLTSTAHTFIAREMVDGSANSKAWSGALELGLSTRLGAAEAELDRLVKFRDIEHKRVDLLKKKARLIHASERREYFAEVLIACPEARDVDVELTYFVGGAAWVPAYEARADEAHGEVELSTFATVTQSTGEDWKDAAITLSTALPRDNATPPEISPLKVYAQDIKEKKKVLVARQDETRHAEASADLDGEADKQADAKGSEGLRAASQGLSVQLVIPDAADIAGDGSPARLLVGKTRMKARFAWKTIPKLMPFVFRVADLVNTAPYPLMPGTLDAFRRGGLSGRHAQERVAQGARFSLTFGAEENFKVKRDVVEEVVRDKNFLGLTRRFKFAYRLEAANYLDAPQELEVAEHVPVSELDDVKVVIDPKATPGYELKADDGIVTWKLRLGPGEKKQLDLAYVIDVPASYDSGSL